MRNLQAKRQRRKYLKAPNWKYDHALKKPDPYRARARVLKERKREQKACEKGLGHWWNERFSYEWKRCNRCGKVTRK